MSGQIDILTETDLRQLLKVHCQTQQPVVVDWVNRTVQILSEVKTHVTMTLSDGRPMTYRDIIHHINFGR